MAKVVKRSDSPLGPKLKRMREAAGISPAVHGKAMGGRVWLECGDGPSKWEWL